MDLVVLLVPEPGTGRVLSMVLNLRLPMAVTGYIKYNIYISGVPMELI